MLRENKHMRYTSKQHIKEEIMERFTRQTTSNASSQQSAPAAGPAQSVKQAASEPTLSGKLLVVSVIVAALAVTIAMAVGVFRGFNTTSLVKSDQYQAVFLDNGQVYFGKLSNVNSSYAKLADIFYLQVEQQIQPEQQEEGQENTEQPQISLAKLGNELHGPEDEMFILQDKIVFWENLKNDGQVVTAITNFKNGGGNDNEGGGAELNQ